MATLTSVFGSPVRSIPPVPGLPLIGNLLKFRRDRLGLQEDAAKVGPLARVQLAHVPIYVVTDAEMAHEVLVANAAKFKKSAGIRFLEPLLGEGLLLSEGDVHRRHRKLLAPAFAPKRLAAYGEVMVDETRRTLAGWRNGARIDLANEMMELTLAIAGKTMFGADVRGDAEAVAQGLELGMRAQQAALRNPLVLTRVMPRNKDIDRAGVLLDSVVYRLIREGRARGTDKGDVLSILLLARDDEDGTGLTDKQIRDEVMTLLLAGHETTANTLTWTWYELARNPDVLAQLQRELEPLGNRVLTVEDLPKLPFNLAVIEESMRLHPAVYATARQALVPVEVGGHMLPEKSVVLVNIRGMHHRPDYFPVPHAFMPERMSPEAKKGRQRGTYLPFGAGPRVCIGAHFALLEAQLALATMVQHMRLRLVKTNVEPEPLVTLRPLGGMPAVVELR